MQNSIWKLTALAGVVGIGFLAVLQVQQGLQNDSGEEVTQQEEEFKPVESDDAESSSPPDQGEPEPTDDSYVNDDTPRPDDFPVIPSEPAPEFTEDRYSAKPDSPAIQTTAGVEEGGRSVVNAANPLFGDATSSTASNDGEGLDFNSTSATQPPLFDPRQSGDPSEIKKSIDDAFAPETSAEEPSESFLPEPASIEKPTVPLFPEDAQPFPVETQSEPRATDEPPVATPLPETNAPAFPDSFEPLDERAAPSGETEPIFEAVPETETTPTTKAAPAVEMPRLPFEPVVNADDEPTQPGATPLEIPLSSEQPASAVTAPAEDEPADASFDPFPAREPAPSLEPPTTETNPFSDPEPTVEPVAQPETPAEPVDPNPIPEQPTTPRAEQPAESPSSIRVPDREAFDEPQSAPETSDPLPAVEPFLDPAAEDAFGQEAPQVTPTEPKAPAQVIPEPPTTPGVGFQEESKIPSEPAPAAAEDAGLRPQLTIEKVAPKTATLGQPMTYNIVIRNVSESPAHKVVVKDELPQGADLIGTIPQCTQDDKTLIWSLETMQPGQTAELSVRLVPMVAGQLGSTATVNFATGVAARTLVREPQLQLLIAAPDRVQIGEKIVFRFKLKNTGENDATRVYVREVIPEGLSHTSGNDLELSVGTLAAGATRDIQLTLSAVRAGRAINKIVITADGGLREAFEKTLEVVEKAVALSRSVPKQLEPGSTSLFTTTITNASGKTLDQTTLVEAIPADLEFVEASDGGQFDPGQRTIAWKIRPLAPGATETLEVRLRARRVTSERTVIRLYSETGEQLQASRFAPSAAAARVAVAN